MSNSPLVPIFFGPDENLTAKERTERNRHERAEIIRWKYRFLKLDAIKPGETSESFQIRCRNKRLVHLEHEQAQKELRVKIYNAPVHRRDAKSARCSILRLLDEVATYEAKIAAAKIDMNELESQIKRASAELKRTSKSVTSDFAYAEALERSRNELAVMEARLDTARKLEGKLLAVNMKMRSNVEDMLGERKRYNLLFMNYVQQLNRNRKFLLDMIERATLAFNQGEELCHRIDALKTQNQREKRSSVQEMVEMERQIVGTRQVNEFLRTKGFQRAVADLDAGLIRKRDLFKRAHSEKLQRNGEIINDTKKCLNLEDMQQVLCEIEKQQDKYMELFRYINITNNKIEEANAIACDLQKDSADLHESQRRKRCADERRAKDDVEQLRIDRQQTEKMRAEVAQQQENLELKLATVDHALLLVGCDRTKITQMMQGSSSTDRSQLTEDMLKKLLATIERSVLYMVRNVLAAPEEAELLAFDSLIERQQCAECAEGQDVNQHDERLVGPVAYGQLVENAQKRSAAPEMQYRLHTLSQCKLPRSRMLVNKRYQ